VLAQAWSPVVLAEKEKKRTRDLDTGYVAIGRLRSGVKLSSAAAEMQTVQARVAQAYTDPELRAHVSHTKLEKYGASDVSKETTKALLALTAAAGLLWLIACVNATNLLLARASARQREMAMRGALGASRRRLMQQLVVEGLMLSGIAALLGVGLAMGSIRVFHHILVEQLPSAAPATVSVRVLAALAGLVVVSGPLLDVACLSCGAFAH
jgi:ABC-type lipoprotein release transport system permease subunit